MYIYSYTCIYVYRFHHTSGILMCVAMCVAMCVPTYIYVNIYTGSTTPQAS